MRRTAWNDVGARRAWRGTTLLDFALLPNVKRSLYVDVNHSSCRSSFAVGLSLGSNFMILSMNALSSFEISRSVMRPNGFIFSRGTRRIMWVRIANVSLSAISLYDSGNGPKNWCCFMRIFNSYSSWSAGTSGLKMNQFSPHIKVISCVWTESY